MFIFNSNLGNNVQKLKHKIAVNKCFGAKKEINDNYLNNWKM